jgi:hypothetical protein
MYEVVWTLKLLDSGEVPVVGRVKACGVNGKDFSWDMAWVQVSASGGSKNLVVEDGSDGENPQSTLIHGDDVRGMTVETKDC